MTTKRLPKGATGWIRGDALYVDIIDPETGEKRGIRPETEAEYQERKEQERRDKA